MNEQVKMVISKKKSSLKKRLILYFVIPCFLIIGSFGWATYFPKNNSGIEKTFIVQAGQGLKEIAYKLKGEGFIRSSNLFKLLAVMSGAADNLLAGEYILSPKMSSHEILNKLKDGDVKKEYIVVIEGWDLKDIAGDFENKGIFKAEEVFEATGRPAADNTAFDSALLKDFADEFEFLKAKPKAVSLEGFLFPDTYELGKNEAIESIVGKMLANFGEKIAPEIKDKIEKSGRTLFEILTMASLLEKEVKTIEDKKMVAGVLWKRLDNWWRLQVDATVAYIVGRGSLELFKSDLETDSPYNTYKYYGLPLGPICNPGLDSIRAAIDYTENDYWFYLTTRDGKTIFSKTLEEHGANKAKYLK